MKRLLPLILCGAFGLMPKPAEASKFYTNYNNPDLQWYTIETDNLTADSTAVFRRPWIGCEDGSLDGRGDGSLDDR